MELKTRTEWTVAELSGELEFTIVRQEGLLAMLARLSSLAILLVLAWKSPSLLWRCLFALGALWPIADWLQGQETQLRVSAQQLTASGNIGRLARSTISVPAARVRSIEYFAGDDGEHSGLYAMRKWGRICLVPDLDEPDCREVASRIAARFPEIGADHDPNSLLYADRNNLTVLGLTDSSRR